MPIASDFSVATNGDIRYTGSGTNYTVIEFHRYLGVLMDDAQASGDDLLDITDATASERATDNYVTLKAPYNVDDRAAQHLYDGSIVQADGGTFYDGIVVYAPTGTPVDVLQAGKLVTPNFWDTKDTGQQNIDVVAAAGTFTRAAGDFVLDGFEAGQTIVTSGFTNAGNNTTRIVSTVTATVITVTSVTDLVNESGDDNERVVRTFNADAAQGISHRMMIKVRTGGTDIDGRKLVGTTRSFGKTYGEFKINGTSRGNNVLAFSFADDLNNATALATVKSWVTIGNTTEGYKELDVDNDTVLEPYYSEWNKAAYSINQLYERLKWLTKRAVPEDQNGDSGTNYAVGNATINGQAQSFSNGVNAQYLMRAHVRLKKTGAPTGNLVAKLYTHLGTYGTDSTPDTLQATSVNIDVSKLTTSYQEIEIGFTTPFKMLASTYYVIAIEYTAGSGANYVQVEGKAVGTHGGNRAQKNGTWVADAGSDLWFKAYVSPDLYKLPGEWFRGITYQIAVDTQGITDFLTVEPVQWTGGTGQMVAVDDVNAASVMWIQILTGSPPTDGLQITGVTSGATCDVNVTVTERTLSTPFCGASTGTALIGSYGLGVELLDLTANDKLTDLDAVLRLPPNNVTFTLGGLVATEDRALVTPLGYTFQYDNEASGPFTLDEALTFGGGGTAKLIDLIDNGLVGWMTIRMLTGTVPVNNESIAGATATADVNGSVAPDVDVRQFTLDTALTGAGETQAQVSPAIPSDTPSPSGTIRIETNSGIFRRVAYSSWAGDIFTFTGAENFTGDNASAGNNVYVSYIDKAAGATSEAFIGVYTGSPRSLFIRVRDGGGTPIKTFETTGTLGSAGGSATAIRTPDA